MLVRTTGLEPEAVADIVGAQFPELRSARVTYLGEGCDNAAFDVNGQLVFRFPKRLEVEQQLLLETDILPLLAKHTPVPVPVFTFQGAPSPSFPRHFVGYSRLPGVPAIGLDPTQVPFRQLAPLIGGFLSFLHSFPTRKALDCGAPEHLSGELIAEGQAEALGDLHLVREVDPDAPEAALRSFLEAGVAAGEQAPVVVHGDLAAEHILLDLVTCRVTGIIDWSEIAVGDPAIDFGGLFHWGGSEFTHAVVAHYRGQHDAGLENRARFFAACRGVGDIAFGLEMQRGEYIEAGVRALRHCSSR